VAAPAAGTEILVVRRDDAVALTGLSAAGRRARESARLKRYLDLLVTRVLDEEAAPDALARPDELPELVGWEGEAAADPVAVDLDAVRGGLWWLALAGPAGSDVDLYVGAGEDRWTSSFRGPNEELLLPGRRDLRAVVALHEGDGGAFRLVAGRVVPAPRLHPGRTADGVLGDGPLRYRVHEVTGAETGFFQAQLVPEAGREAGLRLLLLDDDLDVELATGWQPGVARSLVIPPAAGRRFLVVGPGVTPEELPYRLHLEPLARERPPLEDDGRVAAEVTDDRGVYVHVRTRRPEILTIRLEGPAGADLDMAVYTPDGDMRTSTNPDSREDVAVNGARYGEYLVHVYPGVEGARGELALTARTLEVSRLAEGSDGPRTWAVFAGVGAYRWLNRLRYTCRDALGLFNALGRSGVVDPDRSIVLIDERADRATLGRALDAVARRADADDAFLFFFSGHGGNDARDGEGGGPRDEDDGADEYLACFDSNQSDLSGDLTDDDLRGHLDRIAARRQLVVLDVCYAGGFAELVDRPGRWGLFASLESRVANEAEVLRAGLLTGAILDALAGEADDDRDGRVTLDELSGYVTHVVPRTCPACDGPIFGSRCRSCWAVADEVRQDPVVVDRHDGDLVLATPGRRD